MSNLQYKKQLVIESEADSNILDISVATNEAKSWVIQECKKFCCARETSFNHMETLSIPFVYTIWVNLCFDKQEVISHLLSFGEN